MSCELAVAILGFTFLALLNNHNTALIASRIDAMRDDMRHAATPAEPRAEENR